MENWLERMRENVKSQLARILINIVIVFLTLAGTVAIVSDLGLGDEITRYRLQIWAVLFGISIFVVLTYSLVRLSQQASVDKKHLYKLETELKEAQRREQSLLRLMEKYKSAAYTEILDHLKRITILVANRQYWQEIEARITKVSVKATSDAEEIDPEFAMRDRIDVIINIGKQENVIEGIEFLVRDPNIPDNYGLIAVKKVYEKGATCTLMEDPGHSFWGQALELSKQSKPATLEMPDNRIIPNLPKILNNLTPELAEELKIIIERIAYNNKSGVTS